MEYVNILSLVMDSDTRTTNEFKSLFEDMKTEYFDDSSRISDEPIMHRTDDGRYLCLYRENGDIVLDYYINGTGSFKSCTKKIKLEFSSGVKSKLLNLETDEPISLADDIMYHRQLIMIASSFDLTRDKVDPNQVTETEKYVNYYFLRKNKDNHYFLQSEIWPTKLPKHKDVELSSVILYFDILPTFQRMLKTQDVSITTVEDLEEIENNPELQDLYDFDDIDEDEEFEYYEDVEDNGFTC